jgi:hypothetical protein
MAHPSGPTRVGSPIRWLAASTLLVATLFAATMIAAGITEAEPKPAVPKAPSGSPAPVDLPHYVAPPAYSVDLVIHSPKANMVMKRYIDQGRIRTEMSGSDMDMVMIEMGDAKGTSLMLMPKDKRAIKQSREGMASLTGGQTAADGKHPATESAAEPPSDMRVEDLGDETLDGKAVKKLRVSLPEGSSLGWFDKTTGAPVRMEGTVDGETSVIEWKDYKVGAQPAKLFEAPKDYELTDMDEMMSKMKGMGGMGGMKGLMGGMPGMGGISGVKGMVGGMGQNLGGNLGGSLGASLGGALGGPLGAMAGKYLGGKVGGMIGRKAANVVTPGN